MNSNEPKTGTSFVLGGLARPEDLERMAVATFLTSFRYAAVPVTPKAAGAQSPSYHSGKLWRESGEYGG